MRCVRSTPIQAAKYRQRRDREGARPTVMGLDALADFSDERRHFPAGIDAIVYFTPSCSRLLHFTSTVERAQFFLRGKMISVERQNFLQPLSGRLPVVETGFRQRDGE